MSLHVLDALNRQQDAQHYTAPIEPDLAPRSAQVTPEATPQPGIVERIRSYMAHLAINK